MSKKPQYDPEESAIRTKRSYLILVPEMEEL